MGKQVVFKSGNLFKDRQDTEFRQKPIVQFGILVRDVKHSLDFYVNSLGCRLKTRSNNLVILEFFGTELSLIKNEEGENLNYAENPNFFFGLRVHWDDWHRLIDHLNYIGIKYNETPLIKNNTNGKNKASFSVKDPSGNILKISSCQDEQF